MFEKDFVNEEFDAFVEYVRNLPKAKVKVLDVEKYMTMLTVAIRLKKILSVTMEKGEINVEIDPDFGMGCITVEMDDLIVEEPSEFADILSEASNFEIYPLVSGKMRLSVTFHKVLKAIE